MLRYARPIFLSAVLAFFSILMVRITLPYLSLDTDIGFLRIKQWIIHNDVWLFAFFAHVFTSVFVVLAGFTQFYNPFPKKLNTMHRMMGKAYVIIVVLISGPAGFVMSLYANGGWSSRVGFSILSILWIYFTARAFVAIRQKNFSLHGKFMIRSYALTLSALTLRAWKYVIVLLFQPHPMDAYQVVAWLGWIPNLLIAEWLIRKNLTKKILANS
jgi:uncharacterized membrane protein